MCSAASLLSLCVRRRGSSRGRPRPQRLLYPESPAVLPPIELRRSAATALESRAPSMPARWLVRDSTFPAASPPPGGPRHVPAVRHSNKQRPALAGARGSPSPLAPPCWPRARLRTQPFVSSASASRAAAMLDADSFQHLEEASNAERMRAAFELTRPREDTGCGPSEKFSAVDEFQKLSKSDLEEKKLSKSDSDKDYMVPMCSIYDGMHQVEQARRYSDQDVEEVCRILSSSDSWSSMQQALETRPRHFTPDLVIAIMKRCKRKGHAALKFFYWVGKRSYYMHTTDTYNLAMKLAGSAKDFKHMRHLYREMAWAECSPTVGTWNVKICQYGNAGLTEMALETFYQMKQEGFQPDRSTYNHLIMYVSRRKGRKVDAAIKIFTEMIHAGYILDSQVLCGYILALCECGILVDARTSIVSLCKQGFPVQIGYSILLRSLCRSDKKEEAVSLFDDIEKCGCSRNEYTYGSLIHALLRWDRFEDAVAKLAEMKNAGICQSTHIYTSFIVYFFQKRDVTKAMDMFKEMTENGCEPTVITYSALIRGLMGMGMLSEAWDILRRMKLKGPLPDFETYSMFITYLCKAGRSEDGLQLIHDMLDGGIIPSTVNFRTVVHGLNMEGKHKLADSVLQSKWHLRRQRSFSEDSMSTKN